MKVFKFGGASIKNSESVRNLFKIVKKQVGYELVIVVSAMGKTTNALEKLTHEYFNHDADLNTLLAPIRTLHLEIAEELFLDKNHKVFTELENIFETIKNKCLKLRRAEADHDFLYDQIVPMGEILSSTIVSEYLNEQGIYTLWLDARKLIKTDNNYREAAVDWETTSSLIKDKVTFEDNCVYIVQGFIGFYKEDYGTTLGREGSDFTAAIFGNILDANEVVIWKDVPGLLNADPKYFSNTKLLSNISYHEAVELSYYGATVIHPKTIKPLQNKSIPLYVKSFKNDKKIGSIIDQNTSEDSLVPSYIFKNNQVLLSILTRDYSFISEHDLSKIFDLFAKHKVKINLMENSAISFTTCFDNDVNKLNKLTTSLQEDYKVLYNEDVDLMTIRHYDQTTLDQLMTDREILIEQKSRHTARLVMKSGITNKA